MLAILEHFRHTPCTARAILFPQIHEAVRLSYSEFWQHQINYWLTARADSEVWLVLLHLHHEVVDVEQLGTNCELLEGCLAEYLLETVVVLDQLH